MSRRRFDPVVVPVGDGTPVMRRVHRFRCPCGTVHDVSANTYGGSRNTEDLGRIMHVEDGLTAGSSASVLPGS